VKLRRPLLWRHGLAAPGTPCQAQPQPPLFVASGPQQRDFSPGAQQVARSLGVQQADREAVPAPVGIDAAGVGAINGAEVRAVGAPVAASAPRTCGESAGMDGP
jgi:hypothetical protein